MAINNVAKSIIQEFGTRTFVETGVYQGLTTGMVLNYFKELGIEDFSIWEVDIHEPYITACREKFTDPRVEFVTSDSSEFLFEYVKNHSNDSTRHLFFLDAHIHCGIGTNPLYGEIEAILKMENKPIIIIDDFENPLNPTHNWTWDPSGNKLCIASIQNLIQYRTDIVYCPIEGEHETCQGQGIIFVDEYADTLRDKLTTIAIQGVKI